MVTRRRFARLIVVLGITSSVVFAGLPAVALTGSPFEGNDGNLVDDAADPRTQDWGTSPPNLTTKSDLPSGGGDDSFGQGTKEDTAVPTVVSGGIPGNKSDLLKFLFSSALVGSDFFIRLGWTRANTLGSANMDFEINQSNLLSGNGKTSLRLPGDALITYDFSGGGKKVELGLLRWLTSLGPTDSCFSLKTPPCWGNRIDLDAAGFAEGKVNDGFAVADPFGAPGSQILDKRFGEAEVNLSKALNNPCPSFAKAYVKSRSSDAFTAALKDFIVPTSVAINPCNRTIRIKKIDSETSAPLAGAVFQLFFDENNSGVLEPEVDTQVGSDCTTALPDGVGNCIFTVNRAGQYIVREKTAPPGYAAAPDRTVQVTLGPNTQPIEVVVTNAPIKPATIKLKKVDQDGATLAGAVMQLFRDSDGTPGISAGDPQVGTDCTTSGSDGIGNCSFVVNQSGTYCGREKTPPPDYNPAPDQCMAVTLTTQPQTITLTFVDQIREATIKIKKVNETGFPLAGAVFQLFFDANTNGTADPGEQVNGDCTTALPDGIGNCIFMVNRSGSYIVREKTPPPGRRAVADRTISVVLAGDPQTIVVEVVNECVDALVDPSTANAHGSVVSAEVDDRDPAVTAHAHAGHLSSSQTGIGGAVQTDDVANVALNPINNPPTDAEVRADVLKSSTSSTVTATDAVQMSMAYGSRTGILCLPGSFDPDMCELSFEAGFAMARAEARPDGANVSALGSGFENLQVRGTPLDNISPNTEIDISDRFGPGSRIVLYETAGGTSFVADSPPPAPDTRNSGTFTADVSVIMVHVFLKDADPISLGDQGPVEIKVLAAEAHASFKQPLLCEVRPVQELGGHAFLASLRDPLLVTGPRVVVGRVDLDPMGGHEHADIKEGVLNNSVGTPVVVYGAGQTDTIGSLTSGQSGPVRSLAEVANLCIHIVAGGPCEVTADLVRAVARSQANASSSPGAPFACGADDRACSTDFETMLLNLIDPVLCAPPAGCAAGVPANTGAVLPLGAGVIVVNEQFCDGSTSGIPGPAGPIPGCPDGGATGGFTSGLTVRTIRISLITGIEIIIGETHSYARYGS